MAVTTQKGQIVNGPGAFAGLVQGLHVMAFDEALASVPVPFFKVASAYLADERTALGQDAPDLPFAELRTALAHPMESQQVTAFHDALVLVVGEG
jgi:hypothetical protein